MGMLENLEKAHRVVMSAVGLHQGGKYLHENVIKPRLTNECTSCSKKFAMVCPKSGIVGNSLIIKGLSSPGVVLLYSNDKLERKTYPDPHTGQWAVNEFFSKPGTYLIRATNGIEEENCEISISPA